MSLMFKVVVACVVATLVWVFALTRHPRVPVAVVAVTSVEPRPGILTAQDRCEVRGCGAQAYFRALFEPTSDEQKTSAIDWCLHHWREVEEKVSSIAYHVINESYKLGEPVKSDA